MVWVKVVQTEIEEGGREYNHQIKRDVGYFYDKIEEELKFAVEEKNQSLIDIACYGCGSMIFKEDKIWGNRFKPLCQGCSHGQERGGNINSEWDDNQWEWQEGEECKTIDGSIPANITLKCDQCGKFSMYISKTKINEVECHNELCSSRVVPSDKLSLQNGSCQKAVF